MKRRKGLEKTPSRTRNEPAARALDGEEEDDNEYEEEDPEQDPDPQEEDGDDQDDEDWWEEIAETEQTENEESMFALIISQMKKYADESDKERKEDLTVQALGIDVEERPQLIVEQFPEFICKAEVLLDG